MSAEIPGQPRYTDLAARVALIKRHRRNLAVHSTTGVTLIPPSGSMTIAVGEPVVLSEGVVIAASDTIPVELEASVEVAKAQPLAVIRWLDQIAFCIPKSFREPFLGDLREDVADKLAAGCSRSRITLYVVVQIAIPVLRGLWSLRTLIGWP